MGELEDLKAENEKLRRVVAGSDRTVDKHVKKIRALEAELDKEPDPADQDPDSDAKPDAADTDEPDAAAELAKREARLVKRERIFDKATQHGIVDAEELQKVFDILGVGDDESDDDGFDSLSEYTAGVRQTVTDEILKNNAAHPHESVTLEMEPVTLEAIAAMPDHVQRGLSPETTQAALQAQIAKEKKTWRQGLSERLFGGRK